MTVAMIVPFRLAAVGVAALVVADAAAQATRVERHAFARFEALRTELLTGLSTAPADLRARVADVLAEDGWLHPFDRLAGAFAALRGVDADPAFRYRAGVLPLVLPWVADPAVLAEIHTTAHAPRILPDLPDVRFAVALTSTVGELLHGAEIDAHTDLDSVLRFRATTPLPVADLADGRYRVAVATRFGAAGPRPADVAAAMELTVLHGFKARAEALPLAAQVRGRAEVVATLLGRIPEERRRAPLEHALLLGACWPVERAFLGEPRLGDEDPVRALATAERIFANLCEGRAALDGVVGPVTLGLPGAPGDDGAGELVIARLSVPEPGAAPRPLCVVMPGTPAWDLRGDRPMSPASSEPAWLAERLARVGFDAGGRLHVAVLESPGRFANPAVTLRAATRALREILPVGDLPTVWIGEREAAWAASRALVDAPGAVRGLVLVGGVGLSQRDVEALDPPVPVLGVTAVGHPASDVLARLAAGIGDPRRFAVTEPAGVAWSLALPLRAAEVEAFVLRACGLGG
ncbi:MAG: hypothetical protein IPM29_00930 [Planctomycetes bacterium]|nr:hypothetical protein [Planctomycetota bacterium]